MKRKSKLDWYALNEGARFVFTVAVIVMVVCTILNGGW